MANVRFATAGTAETVARGQDYGGLLNSLVLCAFSHAGYAQFHSAMGFPGITAKEVTRWFRLATGMEKDFDALMESGERMFTLRRLINLRLGLDPSMDTLPERLMKSTRNVGPAADHLPPITELVSDYYRARGWTPSGEIGKEKLEALGLA